ncbi:MAG: flagellar hook-associated protein FlgK [Candidatus Hydrogenedentota bacterium]
MGTLFSTLDIGRAGLHVAQTQLDVTGHNIANVNKEGFSRQRVNLTTQSPIIRPYGAIGRGPAIQSIERLRDEFLDRVYRDKVQDLGSAEVRNQLFNRVEDIFQEPTGEGFSQRIATFFDALSDFSTNVEDLPTRVSLLAESEALTEQLNTIATRIDTLRSNANEDVRDLVPEVNSIMERIAELNPRIRDAELTGRQANDMRDDRDMLIDELASLINLSARERDNGQVDIVIGGVAAVTGDRVNTLQAVPSASLDPERGDLLEVQFAKDGSTVNILNGELAGALTMRDEVLPEIDAKMDTFANTLIQAFNRIHSQGNGITNIDTTLTSEHAASAAGSPLSGAGLPFSFQDGAFDVVVYDSAGNITANQTINITNAGTSLNDIAAAIDGVGGVSATVNPDNTLSVTPGAGNSFTFANDSSGVLQALGLNSFFTGTDARTIGVSQLLRDRPELVSSAYNLDPLDTGDNAAALDLSALRNEQLLASDTQSLPEFYESTIVEIGVDARANTDTLDVERSFVEDFDQRRQEVQGVNLDEEVTFLIQVQRAYEGAARLITTTDRMLETLVSIVR